MLGGCSAGTECLECVQQQGIIKSEDDQGVVERNTLPSVRELNLRSWLQQDHNQKHTTRIDENKTFECSEVAAVSADLNPIEHS